MKNKLVELVNVSKSFGSTKVLDELCLEVKENEFLTLLGPSGCGKTTTLRIIGGFEKPDSGKVFFDGADITNVPANKRNLNTVFQKYALFGHMTIEENIAFGLKIKNKSDSYIKDKIKYALKLVNLEGFEKRKPTSLSGGQQQRIAIARAIVNEPKVLLLDEPLGALDLKLRQDMQYELMRLKEELGITFIYITHDQEEALTMSDKIIVMNKGYIQQMGTPEDIYNEPINAFVADFIGESNIFNGIVTGKLKARFCGGEFVCVDDMKEGTHITAVVRPEDVQIVAPENGTIRGTVTSVIFKGMHYEITIESGKNEIVAQSVNVAKVGQRVGITVEPDNIHLMITEDHTNFFKVEINKNKELEYNDNVLDVSLTDIIKGSYFDEDGDLVDSNGIEIDTRKIRVTAAIQPRDIRMTDEQEEGLVQGYISNLIYEGDHYSYVIHTDLEHDFVVDDEYLWNMDDQVGLIMPVDKMKFTVKR